MEVRNREKPLVKKRLDIETNRPELPA